MRGALNPLRESCRPDVPGYGVLVHVGAILHRNRADGSFAFHRLFSRFFLKLTLDGSVMCYINLKNGKTGRREITEISISRLKKTPNGI